jgi:FkbM family methyltransferase
MTAKYAAYRLANVLFTRGYPLYRPLYSRWKAFADRHERRLLKTILKPGMTAVDVGANIGVYTRFLAREIGSTGRVHAFEPAQQNFSHLEDAVRGLRNVTANHAAVGECSETTTLYLSDQLNVDHRTYDSGDGRAGVSVEQVALDDYFPGASRVDFMKVDVQGFELQVLRGARRLMTENAGLTILMEFWPYGLAQASTRPRDLIDFARGLGFSAHPICGTSSPSIEQMLAAPQALENYWNIVLIRSGVN